MNAIPAAGGLLLIPAMLFGQAAGALPSATMQRALVNQYCLGCHNDRLKSGGFSWAAVDLPHPGQHAEQLERAIRKLRAGLMPPAGVPRPDAAAIRAFAAALEAGVDQAAAVHPNPGRPALHRLNRTEYRNSVHDLLALDVDVASLLPPDDMSRGFDNMSDVLTVSPTLMEAYIRAAGRISREAVGDASAAAHTTAYQAPRVFSQTRHVDATPFGTRGGIAVVHSFPADGEYTFKLGFYYGDTGPLFGLNQGKGQQIEVAVDGARVALLDINPNMRKENDGIKTRPVKIQAGPHRIAAAFLQKSDGPIEDEVRLVEQSLVDVAAGTVPGMTTLPHLHELAITGPVNVSGVSDTPSRRKIFVCRPAPGEDEVPCARKIVSTLARQAFRRPAADRDLEDLLGFYQRGRNDGDFESGIRTAIQAILSSPEFVFRFERVPAHAAAGANYRVGDLELASRLSYFLWSTAPDEPLLALAAKGKLSDPAVLDKQVRRMLADQRSAALTLNFAHQWLHLQNLKIANPDLLLFPDFDKTLSEAMLRETEMLFDSIVREDRNILDLLTADYTFVNERLAKHYGIPNVLGNRFRRVAVTDPDRLGLLGHASVLMLTSTATRTSPVVRGKYVMEVLLGSPPPPPLPNVPPLKETAHGGDAQSVRERLEEHRNNPACASCHNMMDPIGFALENFDAIGARRTKDSGFPIDASGKMYDGAKLDGPSSLRQAILNHSDAFLRTFAENLLAYGVGRVTDYRDMPAVRAVEHEAAKNGNRFASFVLGVVKSAPFQMRQAEEAEPPATDTVAADRD